MAGQARRSHTPARCPDVTAILHAGPRPGTGPGCRHAGRTWPAELDRHRPFQHRVQPLPHLPDSTGRDRLIQPVTAREHDAGGALARLLRALGLHVHFATVGVRPGGHRPDFAISDMMAPAVANVPMIIPESDKAFWASWPAWTYQMAQGTSTSRPWTASVTSRSLACSGERSCVAAAAMGAPGRGEVNVRAMWRGAQQWRPACAVQMKDSQAPSFTLAYARPPARSSGQGYRAERRRVPWCYTGIAECATCGDAWCGGRCAGPILGR
jgi:hypothetical protein